ncbi:MAG: mechanosensitive ion channel family protein [Crenarchaeota archaeon]|nr:mechanosensitive ion channel family protein [Thermoproteota archaeon]
MAEAAGLVDRLGLEASKVLQAAAILAVGVAAALLVRSLMRRSLQQRLPTHIYKPLENMVFFSLLLVAGVTALTPFGVSPSGLLLAGGFAGIVVGFASQQTVSNLISGVFLLVEQPLRVGDPVTIKGVSGVVVDISILSTRIRTWDGYIVRIPNSVVFNEAITNYVRTRARRVEISVGISYGSSIDKAIEAVKRLMEEHPFCLVNPAPEAFVEEYGDSAVVLKARCWAPPQVWFRTKTELQTRLKTTLEQAGVEIPFPQLDLHIRDSVPLKVELGASGGPGLTSPRGS